MKLLLPLVLASGLCLCAQQPQPAETTTPQGLKVRPPATLLSLPPETVVATIDGHKVLASELQAILRVLPPQQQQLALRSAKQFLDQYGLLRKLSAMAEQAGLDQKSPLKDQLAYGRMVGLAQAQAQEVQNQIKVTPEEVQKSYDSNKDRYQQIKVKVIYFPFSPNATAAPQQDPNKPKVMTEAEAKAKAEKVLAEIRAGADFVKMVKEHSGDATSAAKDGDFGTIKRMDRLADAIKTAVFALKPGEVSEPVRQPNGFYLFRAEESGLQTLDEVKNQVRSELQAAHFNEWMQSTQKSIQIKVEDEALFAPPPAPVQPPVAAPVKPAGK